MTRVIPPIQVGIVILAGVAPFVFPAWITLFLAFLAGLVFPPLAIASGMLVDLLYQPRGYWPVASMLGVVLCILALLVRSFVKTRIM